MCGKPCPWVMHIFALNFFFFFLDFGTLCAPIQANHVVGLLKKRSDLFIMSHVYRIICTKAGKEQHHRKLTSLANVMCFCLCNFHEVVCIPLFLLLSFSFYLFFFACALVSFFASRCGGYSSANCGLTY